MDNGRVEAINRQQPSLVRDDARPRHDASALLVKEALQITTTWKCGDKHRNAFIESSWFSFAA
jgi:hypothetical protein